MTAAGEWSSAGSFVIGADHPCLPGHFPGNPIVPGVVLLDEILARLGRELTLVAAKFTAPVRPGQMVMIQRRPGDAAVDFTGAVDGATVLRGSARRP